MSKHSHQNEPNPDHDHHHLDFDSPSMAASTELQGEVLIDLVTRAVSVVAEQCERQGVDVRRVLDIGCGPGVGTCCLAQRFDSASVLAVDGSGAMLERATARAERLGLAPGVETRRVTLPDDLGTLDRADIVWASMVVHHIGDEEDALGRIRALLEPNGLLALIERAAPTRVGLDDDDLGRPGLWDRLDDAWNEWFAGMRAELPDATTSAEYPAMLEAAGLELLADEELTLVLDAPLTEAARRFAHEYLLRTQERLAPNAAAADLAALDVLVDDGAPQSILRRNDAFLSASHRLYVARPAAAASR